MILARRVSLLFSALGLILFTLWVLARGTGPSFLTEPLVFLLVLGTILLFSGFSYSLSQIASVFRHLFTQRAEERSPECRPILAQLALNSLIAGLVLAVLHVLYRLGQARDPVAGAEQDTIRTPFIMLFYSVLMALGFWIVAGSERPSPANSGPDFRIRMPMDKKHLIASFFVLLLMIGILSLLIMGMNMGLTVSVPEPGTSVGADAIFGLKQGDDMIWRPFRKESLKKTVPSVETGKSPRSDTSGGDFALPPETLRQEPPLRWETTINRHSQDEKNGFSRPALKQQNL